MSHHIDMNASWKAVARIALAVMESGTRKGKDMAAAEILRMAEAADTAALILCRQEKELAAPHMRGVHTTGLSQATREKIEAALRQIAINSAKEVSGIKEDTDAV